MSLSTRDIEERTSQLGVQTRGSSSGKRQIGGYAATFMTPSRPISDYAAASMGGPFIEQVAPSFFNASQGLNFPDVICTYNHDPNMLLGATRSQTLRLAVDHIGLDYECDLPPCREDTWQAVERGDVGSSSFKFICHDDTWDFTEGMPKRTLLSGKLYDVSAVNVPAYINTSCNVRSVYDSLARFAQAPVEDVEKYWRNGEVRKFFPAGGSRGHSSSGGRRPLSHQERRRQLQLMAYRWETPLTTEQAAREVKRIKSRWERMTARQAQLEVLAAQLDPLTGEPYGKPLTPQQEQVEAMRYKTSRQKVVETLAEFEP
jgi:HK97 family phage prohead protease